MSSASASVWAILPAAGHGERFGGNKLMAALAGEPVLAHTLTAMTTHSAISGCIIAAPASQIDDFRQPFGNTYGNKPLRWVMGGETRRASVYAALQHVPTECEVVLIHDAARPLITHDVIDECLAPVVQGQAAGALTGLPITDTVKQVGTVNALKVAKVAATVPRETLWTVQTPQVFDKQTLLAAHKIVPLATPVTDDAQLLELAAAQSDTISFAEKSVWVVPGHVSNLKITTPADLALAEWWLSRVKTPVATDLQP